MPRKDLSAPVAAGDETALVTSELVRTLLSSPRRFVKTCACACADSPDCQVRVEDGQISVAFDTSRPCPECGALWREDLGS